MQKVIKKWPNGMQVSSRDYLLKRKRINMSKKINILVACGSGVATSTIAQEAVKTIARNAGVDVNIIKATLAEVSEKQKDVDIVLTTANYRKPLDKPYMSVFGLISGVNKAAVETKLAALLKETAGE